jgi:hypothetical protein
MTKDDMNVYGYAGTPDGEKSANDMLERMRRENRLTLEINPSYGCECFLIAQTITLIDRAELKASIFSDGSRKVGLSASLARLFPKTPFSRGCQNCEASPHCG